jgi:hypothetical protein
MNRYVPVARRRATIRASAGGVDVAIPARTNGLFVVFFGLWLVGWAWGEWTVGASLLAPRERGAAGLDLFTLVWLIGWTAGGLFVAASILWMLFGVERLRIARDEVSLRHEALGIGRTRRYDPRAVTRLRALEGADGPFAALMPKLPWNSLGQMLAFDYGAKTVRFGSGIDAAEAAQLVDEISAAATWLNQRH